MSLLKKLGEKELANIIKGAREHDEKYLFGSKHAKPKKKKTKKD